MIRNLLATTALATLIASGAFAQTQPAAPADPAAPATEPMAPAIAPAEGSLASNLIGEKVYNGTGNDAENIGDVNDLVIGKDGNVESVIIGVGGFLGLGEKNVAMDYGKIKWAEKEGDRWIVVAGTKDELKALPSFDRRPYDVQSAPATATDMTAPAPTAPATAEAPAVKGDKPTAESTAPAATTDETKTAAIDKSQLRRSRLAKSVRKSLSAPPYMAPTMKTSARSAMLCCRQTARLIPSSSTSAGSSASARKKWQSGRIILPL